MRYLALLVLASRLFAGIAANTDWCIRTDGNANNGGGFLRTASGTDWTNQASPQYALTGVTSAGAGNVVLSASAAADMVGNVAQVISGTNFTTGFFPILSVVAGVSITFDTNNASASITTGAGASGVINIGGALLTISAALAQGVNGNLYYAKGTFTITSAISLPYSVATTGTPAVASRISGFTTTKGDGGKATITTSTNSITNIEFAGKTGWTLEHLILKTTAGTPGLGIYTLSGGLDLAILNDVVFDGFSIGINSDNGVGFIFIQLYARDVEIKNSTVAGARFGGANAVAVFKSSYIHANAIGLDVITSSDNSLVLMDSVISFNTTNGIKRNVSGFQQLVSLYNCNVRDNGGSGVLIGNSTGVPVLFDSWNTIYWNNGTGGGTTYGVEFSSDAVMGGNFMASNAYGSNHTAATHFYPTGPGAVTLTADPNTNASGGDYSLNSTAGGGAALKAAGYPGVTGFGTGNLDIGPLQSAGGGGSGGQVGFPIVQ